MSEIDLEINNAECVVTHLRYTSEESNEAVTASREILPGMTIVSHEGWSLLGTPLSSERIPVALENEAISRLQLIYQRKAFVLLKSCFSISKVHCVLCPSPTFKYQLSLENFDDKFKKSLAFLSMIPSNEFLWTHAILPLYAGSIGIKKTMDISLPAFLSSSYSTRMLVDPVLQNKIRPA